MGRSHRKISSKVTEADLIKIEKTCKPRTDRPATLPLDEICIADEVFQWRDRDQNLADSTDHFRELVRVLKTTKKPLDPIVVMPVGDRFFLVEGHHRVEAYRAAGWQKRVPVRYFIGTVETAQDEALHLNIKDKLPMTRSEKFDAAFRLVKKGVKTYEQIHDLTTVSVRTINTMAKALRECPDLHKERSWRRALWSYQRQINPEIAQLDDNKNWREQKAQKLAKQLIDNVGTGFVKDPDITARALEIIDEKLPRALVYQWLDTAQDVLVEEMEAQGNKAAQELLLAFIYGRRDQSFDDAGEL